MSGRKLEDISFMDDASRLMVGYGLFSNATAENSVEVLEKAVAKHGAPKAMLTGRDTQFYATFKDEREAGETYFQKFPKANHIKHILARVSHLRRAERLSGSLGKSSGGFTTSGIWTTSCIGSMR